MRNVSASYDSKNLILKNVSMNVKRGTNYAIVGASGSGKSTLLKLMNGMMIPSSGVVLYNYQKPDLKNKEYKKSIAKIGYIPQTLGLVKNTSVLENVLIGALPRLSNFKSFFKMFPKEEIEKAHEVLDLVGLDTKSNRKVHMLSGGEKRRVAIARALMQKPDVLLADEIVSELDSVTAREVMDVIKDAQKKFKLTAIMIHHDMTLALEYANRVAVIQEGDKILEIGVDGDQIIDFQTGNLTQEEILEMYNEPEPNLGIVLKEMTEFESEHWGTAFWAMLETIEMAFIGTILGVVISLPISIFAARNISNKYVYGPLRALLAATRTFPSILWAILFVIVVGLGPFAGILAITLYTIGFISKLQYESIEAIDYDPVEATTAIGLSKIQLIRYVIIPESAPHLLSQILYMFDYNVRQTSILGIVGAGGIGFYIINYIKFFEYGKAAVFMLVVLVTVLAIDWASVKIRDRYIMKAQHGQQVKPMKN